MKAIQVMKPGEIKIIEREIPNIGADQVLVKTKAAGICFSDMHIYYGDSPFAVYPRVIGHEVVGEVEKIGELVTTLHAGDHVVLEPIEYCGKCYACRVGRPNVCENLTVRGVNSDGGFQEYFSAYESKLYKLPENMPWEKAVLIEPFTIGAQACMRGDVKENDLVLVLGAGNIGLAVLEHAKLRKAKCIVVDINDKKLEIARQFGADYVINSDHIDMDKAIRDISGDMLCNVVIDAVGLPSVLEHAITLTSVAGRVVCLGFTDSYASISMKEVTKKEITLVGSRLQTYQFEKCVKIFSESDVNITKIVTHILNYDEIYKAIDLIENYPEQTGKIILKFNS